MNSDRASHYVKGIITKEKLYELRIDGRVVETSENCVDLYWKARRAVNGKPEARASVEAIKGFYSGAWFSDESLKDWERHP